MSRSNFLHLLSLVLSLFFFIITTTTKHAVAAYPVVKAGYYPSWALDSLPPSAIDTSSLTHVFYAFLVPNSATFKFDISDSEAKIYSDFTATLHGKNPQVKVLYSIGGGGVNPFSPIASSASSRGTFIQATIEIARKYGFDGMDLDWEFPESTKEMADFALLLDEWRRAIEQEARVAKRPPLLLTAAVYYSPNFVTYGSPRSYPAASIRQNLNWINVMCYDYHGSWDTSATGAHAALVDPKTNLSSMYGLKSWFRAGVPEFQVVMGLPLYGKTWKLKDPNVHGVGAAAVDVGPGDAGVLTYAQVEEFNRKNNATVAYDADTASVYSFVGTTWIGYDNALSTTVKVWFAQSLRLRGYFFWAISYDNEWEITTQASRVWFIGK